MVDRVSIAEAAMSLTIANGKAPSLAEVAKAVGLSKQGVIHHYSSRAALDQAVVDLAIHRVDIEMSSAAKKGRATEAYLRLATPADQDRAVAVVVLPALLRPEVDNSLSAISTAVKRWEQLIAAELGDPIRARVVRLVGDGLFSESLITGRPPSKKQIRDLVNHLTAGTRREQP